MATTNYALAELFQVSRPHTFNALQHLVMAMADYNVSRGKRTLFGRDRGLKAYKRFEDSLRDTLLAMALDGTILRDAPAADYLEQLLTNIKRFADTFPNWQDGYAFAAEYFIDQRRAAEHRIQALIGLRQR